VKIHHQVPGGLHHPGSSRVGCGAEDAHPVAGVLDDGEDVHPGSGQRHGIDEVRGQQRFGLGAQEVGPGGGRSLGCRVDPGVAQDLPDSGRGDRDFEGEQFTVQPRSAGRAANSR
jgi:hypothetical protein